MRATKFSGIYEDRGNIYTVNSVKGQSVYGERLFSEGGKEYRQWNPKRSKLGAGLLKKVNLPKFASDDVWLYLGSASGTTVSHVSDMVPDGLIFAVDFAPRVMRDFLFVAKERKNIVPILGDSLHPEKYMSRVSQVDILFQDIAQRSQVDIFLRNMMFLKDDGFGILSLKARSIDVSKKPQQVFTDVRKQLQDKLNITDIKTLDPYQEDHAMFVVKKR